MFFFFYISWGDKTNGLYESYNFLNEAVDDPLQLLFLLLTADEWRFSVQRVGDVLTRVSMIIYAMMLVKFR
jgi:hypothetical protein